jgi:hypothetical protein
MGLICAVGTLGRPQRPARPTPGFNRLAKLGPEFESVRLRRDRDDLRAVKLAGVDPAVIAR